MTLSGTKKQPLQKRQKIAWNQSRWNLFSFHLSLWDSDAMILISQASVLIKKVTILTYLSNHEKIHWQNSSTLSSNNICTSRLFITRLVVFIPLCNKHNISVKWVLFDNDITLFFLQKYHSFIYKNLWHFFLSNCLCFQFLILTDLTLASVIHATYKTSQRFQINLWFTPLFPNLKFANRTKHLVSRVKMSDIFIERSLS